MTQSNTIRHSKFNSIAIAAVFALVVCLAVPAAQAAPVIPWVGGDGNFSDVYNGGAGPAPQGWDHPSKPNSGLLGYVTTGATVTVDQFGEVAWVLTLGTDPYGTISGDGHLAIGAGSFSTAQITVGLGPDSTGSITQTGGSMTVYSKSGLSLGNNGSNGTYTISGGSLSLRGINHDMHVGRSGVGGAGKFNIIGDDALILLGILTISEGAGATGILDLDIDAGGISPIEIVSGGHAHINNGTTGTRTLDISLSGLAPETDLVLIDNLGASNVLMGTFDGLPEGAPIQASFDGQTYNWNISYLYGADSNDVALVFDSVVIDVGLAGDYNGDAVVDAADYTIFQDNLGGDSSVLNGNGSGAATVVQADYDRWKQNFGSSGTGTGSSAAVPEPSAVCLLILGASCMLARWWIARMFTFHVVRSKGGP